MFNSEFPEVGPVVVHVSGPAAPVRSAGRLGPAVPHYGQGPSHPEIVPNLNTVQELIKKATDY